MMAVLPARDSAMGLESSIEERVQDVDPNKGPSAFIYYMAVALPFANR